MQRKLFNTASKSAADRERIMQYIIAQGLRGATDGEMQDALGIPGDTQRPRRDELAASGAIRLNGQHRKSPHSNSPLQIWVAAWDKIAAPPTEKRPPKSTATNPGARLHRPSLEPIHGPTLDAMAPAELLALAERLPSWPRMAGLIPEGDANAARNNRMIRMAMLQHIAEK